MCNMIIGCFANKDFDLIVTMDAQLADIQIASCLHYVQERLAIAMA